MLHIICINIIYKTIIILIIYFNLFCKTYYRIYISITYINMAFNYITFITYVIYINIIKASRTEVLTQEILHSSSYTQVCSTSSYAGVVVL